MEYRIIEVDDIGGVQEHIILEDGNGGYITFPAVDSNPNYIEFKKQITEE
jgi:hypothetical protein